MRYRAAAVVAVLAFTLPGCSDDPVQPQPGAGLYRLASVNGQPVPYALPPSAGVAVSITHGDLLLRTDGTFALGMGAPFASIGFVAEGQWRVSGTALRLLVPGSEITGTLEGDSVVLTPEYRLAYRRSAMPQPPIEAGRYVLATVNGRSDRSFEYEAFGSLFVERVLHDTLSFADGVFFRWSRSERFVHYPAEGDSVSSSRQWVAAGSYDGPAGMLILRNYADAAQFGVRRADTLHIESGALVRRLSRVVPGTSEVAVREDVYTRVQ